MHTENVEREHSRVEADSGGVAGGLRRGALERKGRGRRRRHQCGGGGDGQPRAAHGEAVVTIVGGAHEARAVQVLRDAQQQQRTVPALRRPPLCLRRTRR